MCAKSRAQHIEITILPQVEMAIPAPEKKSHEIYFPRVREFEYRKL
jgi:hypothetical protein